MLRASGFMIELAPLVNSPESLFGNFRKAGCPEVPYPFRYGTRTTWPVILKINQIVLFSSKLFEKTVN
jgi:hypothetical protein